MEPVLVDAVRTPFGRSSGGLSETRTDDLAAIPLRELALRNPELDPASIDEVVLGDANGAGEDNRNVARMAALLAGLPVEVPAVTVNRLCGSGAEALIQAARQVRAGDATCVVAGGVEGMSRAPLVIAPIERRLPRSLDVYPTTVGWRMVNPKFPSTWVESLGRSAELVAQEYGIGRSEQDEWALRSHQRADAAWAAGFHQPGTVSVAGVEKDEGIRPATSLEILAGLPSAFSESGSVTAGNSSPISDGAIAALICSPDKAREFSRTPLGRIVGSAVVGVEPSRFATAPVGAVRKLLTRLGRRQSEIDVLELNEAFAAVVLCCLRDLDGVRPEAVNVHGGAIALGHPLGASAARALVDAGRALAERGGGFGVMAACIGVGQGIAIGIEA